MLGPAFCSLKNRFHIVGGVFEPVTWDYVECTWEVTLIESDQGSLNSQEAGICLILLSLKGVIKHLIYISCFLKTNAVFQRNQQVVCTKTWFLGFQPISAEEMT